jgi:magnesium transporter
VLSNRTNEIMKTLTMFTVMFLPISFLTSFFGMNFFGEPLVLHIDAPRGLLFASACAIMAISPCFLWIYAKRKHWF